MTAPLIVGAGTEEEQWRSWLESPSDAAFPDLDVDLVDGRRVAVVSAHPDDDVLAIGGLLYRLADRGNALVFVWATDGEASHPGSTVVSRAELAALRRAEARAAIDALGVRPQAAHHLGLPDSGLAGHADALRRALLDIVRPDDLLITPWEHDGHPDHDAVGRVARDLPVWQCWQFPVWMWHWAEPADARVPWSRARHTPVGDPARKASAVSKFATQIAPIGPDPDDAAILPPHMLARFQRPMEVVFV